MTLETFRRNARIDVCDCCYRETLVRNFQHDPVHSALTGKQFYLCYVCAELPNRNSPESEIISKMCALVSILLDTLKPPKNPKAPRVARQMSRRK